MSLQLKASQCVEANWEEAPFRVESLTMCVEANWEEVPFGVESLTMCDEANWEEGALELKA